MPESSLAILDVAITNNDNMIKYMDAAKDAVKYVSPENWKVLGGSFANYSRQIGSYDGMIRQANDITKNVGTIGAVVSGLSSGTTTATITVVSVFTSPEIPLEHRIKVVGFTDHLQENIVSIKTNLELTDKTIAQDFDLVNTKWSAAPPTEKSTVLLELRTVIYDKLFTVYSDPFYGRTNWHRSAASARTPFKDKRIAEPRFFMVGVSEDSDIDPTALIEINRIAIEFQASFDQLSGLGKSGGSAVISETEYRRAISLLNQILRLRNIWFKPPT